MARIRADLWCAAFVRRHNDLGEACVVARKGDPIAGQVWVELDHLDGTVTLFAPAPGILQTDPSLDRIFQPRVDKGTPTQVRERVQKEAEFDPDFWLLSVETRRAEIDLPIVPNS